MSPWNCTMLMYWKTDSVGVFCVFVFLCFGFLCFCVFGFFLCFCVFLYFGVGWEFNCSRNTWSLSVEIPSWEVA